jgi:hypothetical protein
MKYLFVSADRVIQQNYRYGFVFRLAGALLILGVLIQVPMGIVIFDIWRYQDAQTTQQQSLQIEAQNLQASVAPLKEVKQKLIQIQQWEPILRSRIPVSALLNAVQLSIPTTLVLESISIESEQFDRLPVAGGIYRVPKEYRVVLLGIEKQTSGVGGSIQEFNDEMLKRLPTGTEVVRSEYLSKSAAGLIPFVLQYAVKPSGNYFGLGLKRVTEPDTL